MKNIDWENLSNIIFNICFTTVILFGIIQVFKFLMFIYYVDNVL